MIFLRAGKLAASDGLHPMAHIWTARKQAWPALPDDVPQFAASPTADAFAEAIRLTGARTA